MIIDSFVILFVAFNAFVLYMIKVTSASLDSMDLLGLESIFFICWGLGLIFGVALKLFFESNKKH